MKVHDRYVMRLRRNVQFEERRQANQRRVNILIFLVIFFNSYFYLLELSFGIGNRAKTSLNIIILVIFAPILIQTEENNGI